MLSEAIAKIASMALEGQKPFSYKDEANHKTVYMIDGKAVEVVDIKTQRLKVVDLESFIEMVLDYEGESGEVVTIAVCNTSVEAASDRWITRHTVLELAETQTWETLPKGTPTKLSQRAFIDWIRHKMHGTGLDSLLPMLREIQWAQNAEIAATFARGRESLGKSVDAAIANFEKFPEKVLITVTRFPASSGLELPVRLNLQIEALPSEQAFSVWVTGDEISHAVMSTQRHIRATVLEMWGGIAEKKGLPVDRVRVLLC